MEALHPTVSVPPLSCFTSFPSAWSILSASHQTVASPFLKQTRCVLHLMVHSGCCLYPVDSKVPWKCCSPSIVISLLPVLSLNLFQSDFTPTIDPALLLPWSPGICTWSVVSSQSPSYLTLLLFPPSFRRHCFPPGFLLLHCFQDLIGPGVVFPHWGPRSVLFAWYPSLSQREGHRPPKIPPSWLLLCPL